MTTTSKEAMRNFEMLKAMNTIIRNMNHECAYDNWIWLIPDEADDEELMDIATEYPEDVDRACKLFRNLIGDFGKYGFYFNGAVH